MSTSKTETEETDMDKVANVTDIIGLGAGQRGIIFTFALTDGRTANVTFDFYTTGRHLCGKTYAEAEATALAAMAKQGLAIASFSHHIFA